MKDPNKDELSKYRTLFYGYSVAAAVLRDEELDGFGKRLDALEEREKGGRS
jgi:hypothetical protein